MRLAFKRSIVCFVLLFAFAAPAFAANEKESNPGLDLLTWAGGRFGGKVADVAFSHLLKAVGLGGEDAYAKQLAEIKQQLDLINAQLNRMQDQMARNHEAVVCKISEGSYQTQMVQYTNTITHIKTIAGWMDTLPGLRGDSLASTQARIRTEVAKELAAPARIHTLALGDPSANTRGLVDELSDKLRSCGMFINSSRLKLIKDQYNYFAALQVASCDMVRSYHKANGDEHLAKADEERCASYVAALKAKAITSTLPEGAVYEHGAQMLWKFDGYIKPRKTCWRTWEGGGAAQFEIPAETSESQCNYPGWMINGRKYHPGPDPHKGWPQGGKRIEEHVVQRWGDASGILAREDAAWRTPSTTEIQRIVEPCKDPNGQRARDCLNAKGFIDDKGKGEFHFYGHFYQIASTAPRGDAAKWLQIVGTNNNVYHSPCDDCVAHVVFVRPKTAEERFVW